jgi:hypothetical protein
MGSQSRRLRRTGAGELVRAEPKPKLSETEAAALRFGLLAKHERAILQHYMRAARGGVGEKPIVVCVLDTGTDPAAFKLAKSMRLKAEGVVLTVSKASEMRKAVESFAADVVLEGLAAVTAGTLHVFVVSEHGALVVKPVVRGEPSGTVRVDWAAGKRYG